MSIAETDITDIGFCLTVCTPPLDPLKRKSTYTYLFTEKGDFEPIYKLLHINKHM